MPIFTIQKVDPGARLPDASAVSSVAVIAFTAEGKVIVTIHKTRGADLPGGHVEPGEDLMTALNREVDEEVGGKAEDVAWIASVIDTSEEVPEKYRGKQMLIFAAKTLELSKEWKPASDVEDRAEMDVEEALAKYNGDKAFMRSLIDLAAEHLGVELPERRKESAREGKKTR